MKRMCECEHLAHFDMAHIVTTPCGKAGHDYGVKCEDTVEIQTIYGVFVVCRACSEDCWKDVKAGEYKRK